MGGVGGGPIGASPVPGAGGAAAVASGGVSMMANLGKSGGWEPTCELSLLLLTRTGLYF